MTAPLAAAVRTTAEQYKGGRPAAATACGDSGPALGQTPPNSEFSTLCIMLCVARAMLFRQRRVRTMLCAQHSLVRIVTSQGTDCAADSVVTPVMVNYLID